MSPVDEKTTLDRLEDLREFKRLRNYYRRNFSNGESDESFIVWCEDMCEQERKTDQEARR